MILWNPRTSKRIRTISTAAGGDTRSVVFSANSKLLVIGTQRVDERGGSGGGSVSVVHVSSGITKWLKPVSNSSKPVFFHGEGALVELYGRKSMGFRAQETGDLLALVNALSADSAAKWNDLVTAKRGHMLAIGGVDHEEKGTLQIWDFAVP